jgi:hypothetical protein
MDDESAISAWEFQGQCHPTYIAVKPSFNALDPERFESPKPGSAQNCGLHQRSDQASPCHLPAKRFDRAGLRLKLR